MPTKAELQRKVDYLNEGCCLLDQMAHTVQTALNHGLDAVLADGSSKVGKVETYVVRDILLQLLKDYAKLGKKAKAARSHREGGE